MPLAERSAAPFQNPLMERSSTRQISLTLERKSDAAKWSWSQIRWHSKTAASRMAALLLLEIALLFLRRRAQVLGEELNAVIARS